MFNALLTLLSSLLLSGTVGLFSIAGIMTIYAGAPFHAALIMGIVTECSKLVTLSWLYRNWKHASLLLRAPLIAIAIVVMIITNIGVFGFLSKAHLEQGATTIDNSAKVEQLNQQISREQSRIADNDKIIAQMDGAVNSLIGKDQANRSLSVRKSQATQRKQLRDEIAVSQNQIDIFNKEKFTLESDVRKLQLEVGPIRYVSEIFNKGGDEKGIESTVQIFTLLIVLILDPLAVMLLLAANSSFARLKNEKEKITKDSQSDARRSRNQYRMYEENGENLSTNLAFETVSKTENNVLSSSPEVSVQTKAMVNEEKEAIISEYDLQDSYLHEQEGCEVGNEESDQDNEQRIEFDKSVDNKAIREEISEVEIAQAGIISLNEDAIVNNFGHTKSFTQLFPPTYTITSPKITRVIPEGEANPKEEKSSKDNASQIYSATNVHCFNEAEPDSVVDINISNGREIKKIKMLGWIKEFGKE